MTNTANIERKRAASQPDSFSPVSVFAMTINPQRESSVALDNSRGSGAVRGNVRVIKTHGENRERSIGSGHSETENGELLVENYVEAEFQYVTLKVWRPIQWVTDGGRLQAPSPPFSQKARTTNVVPFNSNTRFSSVLINQLNSLRDGHAVSNYSRGSGAERGNVRAIEAHGENRERHLDGHSETENGELLVENYVEAEFQNVTLEVRRPIQWVTDGGRLQAPSPPPFSTKEA